LNGSGESSLSSEVSAAVTPLAPPIPGGVTAAYQSANNWNFISWNASSGATQYKVYWGTSPGVTQSSNVLGPTSSLNFAHSGVVAGFTYYYRVAALNGSGQSALSVEVSAFVPPAPPAPTGVAAAYQSANNWNFISWNAASGATQYKVYWGTSPGVTQSSNVLGPTSSLNFAHSGVVAGFTYYYRVAALNGSGQSAL